MLWVLVSHKWLRWVAAVLMITGAVALGFAAPWLAAVGAGLIAVLIAGWKAGAGFAGMPVFFLLIHLAYLRGLWHAVQGERYVTWKPRSG